MSSDPFRVLRWCVIAAAIAASACTHLTPTNIQGFHGALRVAGGVPVVHVAEVLGSKEQEVKRCQELGLAPGPFVVVAKMNLVHGRVVGPPSVGGFPVDAANDCLRSVLAQAVFAPSAEGEVVWMQEHEAVALPLPETYVHIPQTPTGPGDPGYLRCCSRRDGPAARFW